MEDRGRKPSHGGNRFLRVLRALVESGRPNRVHFGVVRTPSLSPVLADPARIESRFLRLCNLSFRHISPVF